MRMDFTVPQKWNDLSEWQIRMVGRFMFNNRNEKTEKVLLRSAMLIFLLLPRPTFKNIFKAFVLLCYIPMSQLYSYTDFIFNPDNLLTRFPDKIKVGRWPFRKRLYGPAPRLANTEIQELSYADTFYYSWITNKNDIDLSRLTAILYRPKSKQLNIEDIREPFSSLKLESNAAYTDQIPMHLKFMIAHAYSGCRLNFISRHPHVFPRKKNNPDQDKKTPDKPKPYQPFSRIIDSIAMDDVQVFGNHQQVEKVYAPKFLAVYEEKIKRQNERNFELNSKPRK